MTSAIPNATVNSEEIARFDELAATWWDSAGPMWPLHRLNNLRSPFVRRAAAEHFGRSDGPDALKGLSVLDIGCGAGLLSEAMARAGAAVTGIDPVARSIEIASSHAARCGLDVEYLQGSVDAVGDRQFDLVLNMEVVEHVDDLPKFMEDCCSRVRPGGLQVIATLNRNPKSYLFAIIGAEYVLRWLPRGTHDWRKFVKPDEMEAMLRSNGLSTYERAGVSINPFTRAYSITDDTSVNFMLLAAHAH